MPKLTLPAGEVQFKTPFSNIPIETGKTIPWKRTGFALREDDEPDYRARNLAKFNSNGYLRLAKFRGD